MRRQPIIILLLLLLPALAACGPGHLGGNEIAFVRDGHLWTIDPDGTNAFEVVSDGPPVIGYGWSPNHQIFAFRTLDSSFVNSAAARRYIASNPITGLTGDIPGVLNTVGIDGGYPIPITLSEPGIQHSNAWWNPTGNRLLYREEAAATTQNPAAVSWWVSQNDQPDGIARKPLLDTFSIPSISASNSAIGNTGEGVFTTTLAGTGMQLVIHGLLPGHPLPAALERVLWQPSHQNPAILYAIASSSTPSQSSTTKPLSIQLILRDPGGQSTTIATCSCIQFAWSPDGNYVLFSTGTAYTIVNINDNASFSVSGEDGSVPYWSPDSQFLLLNGLHTLQLVHVVGQQQQLLLHDTATITAPGTTPAGMPGAHALLQPLSNSVWASDSRHFLFLTRGRLLWQAKSLSSGNGLYTVSIDDHGQVQAPPAVVDTGNDAQAGWTYENPDTSFLF